MGDDREIADVLHRFQVIPRAGGGEAFCQAADYTG
jgi:hypothetical protein